MVLSMSISITIPASADFVKGNCAYENKWIKINRRNKQQMAIKLICNPQINGKVTLPCQVTLIRVSPRPMDLDNFVTSMKYIKDKIAELIIPGLAKGQADDEKRGITWRYKQEKGKPKIYAIRIEITQLAPSNEEIEEGIMPPDQVWKKQL